MDSTTGVQVVVRVRPLNNKEKQGNTLPIVNSSSQRNEVTLIKGIGFKAMRHTFNFDNVFNEFTTQQEVFEQTLAPLVSDVLKGFESTVFAYGQTGTGKTYTMEGEIDIPTEAGVIPRSCEEIFKRLTDTRYSDSSVRVSYLEIYNEELCDLLVDSTKANNLKICEDVQGKVLCWGLSEIVVTSTTEVLEILRSAQARRRVGETKMNKVSSRSHCLFSLSVTSKELVDGGIIERRGKLHLVDLAGSECAKATGADANSTRLRESQNINKSLLTLGRVITSLRDKTARIPYRDSKLTRLLQEALGGHSKTCIIATLSPSVQCADETLSTLKYAEKAHGIENKTSQAFVRMSTTGEPLGEEREGGVGDARTFSEMEQRMHYMEMQCEEAQAALGRKHEEVAVMLERAEIAEERIDSLVATITTTEKELKEQKEINALMTRQLETERMIVAQQKVLLNARCETEEHLRKEAMDLLESLDISVKNTSEMMSDLQGRINKQEQMKQATKSLSNETNEIIKKINNDVSLFASSHSMKQTNLDKLIENVKENIKHTFSVLDKNVNENYEQVKEGCAKIDTELHTECVVLNEKVHKMSEYAQQQMKETTETVDTKTKESLSLLATLQNLQQQAEKEVGEWCEHMKKNLVVNKENMEKNVSLHHTHLTQQHEMFEKEYMQVQKKLEEQKKKLHSLLSKINAHTSAQNNTHTTLTHTSECMKENSSHQIVCLQKQQQTLTHALNEQKETNISLHETHTLTLSQALEAIKEHTHTQLQALSSQLSSLSFAIKEHEETSKDISSSHSLSLSKTKTSLFSLISAQIEHLHIQGKNLEDVLNNENLLGSAGKKEKEHLDLLQQATQALSTHVSSQLSLLTQQREHILRVLSENLEKNAYAQQQQHTSSLSSSQQFLSQNMQQQLDALTHQKNSLHTTLTSMKKNMNKNETQHLSTLNKTEEEFRQHTSTQISLLEKQNVSLQETLKRQKEGQVFLIDSVMSGVQKLLTNSMQELSNIFLTDMSTLVHTNATIDEETKKMKENVFARTHILQQETEKWIEEEKETIVCVENITKENLEVTEQTNVMFEEEKKMNENLLKETEKWGESDKEIARELKMSVEENRNVCEEVASSLAAFKIQSAQLVDETQKWGQMNQAVIRGVGAAREQNSASIESEQHLQHTVVEHVASLSAESEKWTQSNTVVYGELQKSGERNETLQATTREFETQHSLLLQSANKETEKWGESTKTTVAHIVTAMKENQQIEEMNEKNVKEVSVLIEKAQEEISVCVKEASGPITQEVNTLVADTVSQSEHAASMNHTASVNMNNNSNIVLSLSQQVAAFTAKENESICGFVASRNSVGASYTHHTSGLSSQLSSTSQLLHTSTQAQAKDLSATQQSIQQDIYNMDQKEVALHGALLEATSRSCSSIVSTLKEQGASVEQAASAHHAGVQEAETELKQHTGACSESVIILSSRLSSFCGEDMAMHIPTEPAKVPSAVVFSRNLSRTPPEEVLLGAAALTIAQDTPSASVEEVSDENAHPDGAVVSQSSGGDADPKKKRRAFSDISNALVMEDHADKNDKLTKRPKAGTLPRPSNMKPPTAHPKKV